RRALPDRRARSGGGGVRQGALARARKRPPRPGGGALSCTLQRLERPGLSYVRSEEHTSELQSRENLVCRLLLEKKKTKNQKRKVSTGYVLRRRESQSIPLERLPVGPSAARGGAAHALPVSGSCRRPSRGVDDTV